MTYTHDANELRKQYVKEDGQAPTVQGELMRALDALREDAVAKVGWDQDHQLLRDFIADILLGAGVFQLDEQDEIRADLHAICGPEASDDPKPYERLTARVVQWTELHPEPVPHHPNPALHR